MKSKIVLVKNIARLAEAGKALSTRAYGVPGMGLVHGCSGLGKTTGVAWFSNKNDAVYVRAYATWTPSAMMQQILSELNRTPHGSACNAMLHQIIEALAMSGRPLFIDEADYIVESKRMTESLRDIHDGAGVPVVLVGMDKIGQKLSARKQLTGRIMQDVEFQPCDLEDAIKLATELCDVKIKEDLLARIHQITGGAARNIIVSLARVEQRAQNHGLSEIGLAEWPRTEKFFTGEALGAR